MFRGCSTSPFAFTFCRAAVYSVIVVGIVSTPASSNIFLFTVVTMKEASYGIPTTLPSLVKDAS